MSLTRRYLAPVALPADSEFSVVRDAVVDVNEDGRIAYCGPAAEAALDAGSRVLVAPVCFDLPGQDWRAALAAIGTWIDADGLRFGPADRVELCYGPHSAYALPFEALTVTAEAAAARGALVHIHVAESLAEDQQQRREYGSVPRLLDKAGLLDGRLLAAHAVHLSAEDVALFAEHGTGVAHCPGSNAKLASGTANLSALRAASVAVGLGTDGPASNDDLDLWEEMRLSAMFARLAAMDSLALTAREALLRATRGGAEALGRPDIGGPRTRTVGRHGPPRRRRAAFRGGLGRAGRAIAGQHRLGGGITRGP
jgi:5-methylthioadenosine/S-adenosylhomocysteine deaminase